jgi:hypothetical protein
VNKAISNPHLGELFPPDAQKSLLVFSVIAIAVLFFWLTGYIFRLPDITWFGQLGAVLCAFIGCFCLLVAFVLGSCTARVGT